MKTNFKISHLKISAKVWVCDLSENLKMTKTSYFCSIRQENTCKLCLHSNLIILTDFQVKILQQMKTNFKISQFEDFC